MDRFINKFDNKNTYHNSSDTSSAKNNNMFLSCVASQDTQVKKLLEDSFHFSHRLMKKLDGHIYILKDSSNTVLESDILNFIFAELKSIATKGSLIVVDLGFEESADNIVANPDIPLDILFEDEWLLIVNKPAGIPVHPALHYYETSLSNAVKAHYDSINLKKKIRPINRLDKNTSGVVMFAKSEFIQEKLKKFDKKYYALVEGSINDSGTICTPIKRKNNSIIERCVSSDGAIAITHYKKLAEFSPTIYSDQLKMPVYSLIECTLETGRTHQIRVHLASEGHPILGDDLYGDASSLISRQALHAYSVKFIHPVTQKEIFIEAPLPSDMGELVD